MTSGPTPSGTWPVAPPAGTGSTGWPASPTRCCWPPRKRSRRSASSPRSLEPGGGRATAGPGRPDPPAAALGDRGAWPRPRWWSAALAGYAASSHHRTTLVGRGRESPRSASAARGPAGWPPFPGTAPSRPSWSSGSTSPARSTDWYTVEAQPASGGAPVPIGTIQVKAGQGTLATTVPAGTGKVRGIRVLETGRRRSTGLLRPSVSGSAGASCSRVTGQHLVAGPLGMGLAGDQRELGDRPGGRQRGARQRPEVRSRLGPSQGEVALERPLRLGRPDARRRRPDASRPARPGPRPAGRGCPAQPLDRRPGHRGHPAAAGPTLSQGGLYPLDVGDRAQEAQGHVPLIGRGPSHPLLDRAGHSRDPGHDRVGRPHRDEQPHRATWARPGPAAGGAAGRAARWLANWRIRSRSPGRRTMVADAAPSRERPSQTVPTGWPSCSVGPGHAGDRQTDVGAQDPGRARRPSPPPPPRSRPARRLTPSRSNLTWPSRRRRSSRGTTRWRRAPR